VEGGGALVWGRGDFFFCFFFLFPFSSRALYFFCGINPNYMRFFFFVSFCFFGGLVCFSFAKFKRDFSPPNFMCYLSRRALPTLNISLNGPTNVELALRPQSLPR